MFQVTVRVDKRDNMRNERLEAKMSIFLGEWAEELQEFRKWKTERMEVKPQGR